MLSYVLWGGGPAERSRRADARGGSSSLEANRRGTESRVGAARVLRRAAREACEASSEPQVSIPRAQFARAQALNQDQEIDSHPLIHTLNPKH